MQARGRLDRFPAVGDVRGKGRLIAIELVEDRISKEAYGPDDAVPRDVSEFCVEGGAMVRTIAHEIIISPPLTFTKANVDEVVSVLEQALAAAGN